MKFEFSSKRIYFEIDDPEEIRQINLMLPQILADLRRTLLGQMALDCTCEDIFRVQSHQPHSI